MVRWPSELAIHTPDRRSPAAGTLKSWPAENGVNCTDGRIEIGVNSKRARQNTVHAVHAVQRMRVRTPTAESPAATGFRKGTYHGQRFSSARS